MLYTQKLLAELERKREHFTGYQERYGGQLAQYRDALAQLGIRFPSAAALEAAQARLHQATSDAAPPLGARATSEYDCWQERAADGAAGPPALRFGRQFAHHGEAHTWAERIRGTTTIAVDGSQLLPWRDASVPVALVQAGLFENPHEPPAPYVKDVATEVLAPYELIETDGDTADARTGEVLTYSEQLVHLRRFQLEARVLTERIRLHATSIAAGRPVVAFFDGSLILSFAVKMQPPYRERYVAAVRELLAASREARVPLVGYIDTSYARDVIGMLRGLFASEMLPEPRGLHDALLWHGALGWGDRTPAFFSARDDLSRLGYDETSEGIAFIYLQTAQDRPPARLELPRWVVDEGLLDQVMDVVRCEVIAGTGYVYPIEAADAVAVISSADRAQFYSLFQQFAEREGLGFTISRKALSKSRRRV